MKRYSIVLFALGFSMALVVLLPSCAPKHCVGITGTGNTATRSHQRGGHCAGVNSTGTFKPHVPSSKARENGNFDPKMEKKLAKSKYKPIEKKKLEFK